MERPDEKEVNSTDQSSGKIVSRSVSLIIPVFNEGRGISELEKRVSAVLEDEDFQFEIIIILDIAY